MCVVVMSLCLPAAVSAVMLLYVCAEVEAANIVGCHAQVKMVVVCTRV